MTNNQISDQFELLAKLMELHGENSFKSGSYANAAFVIAKLPKEITDTPHDELVGIKGIGSAIGLKIKELLETGRLPLLDKMVDMTPPGILEIMSIKGLGPKKTAVIWHELGIESLGELEYACNENRLVTLKGFGAKTQAAILQNIEFKKANSGSFLWAEGRAFADHLLARLKVALPTQRFEITGDVRRQCEVVKSVDILTDAGFADVEAYFGSQPNKSIVAETDRVIVKFDAFPETNVVIAASDMFYLDLFKTTGSPEFVSCFLDIHPAPPVLTSEDELFTTHGLQPVIPARRDVKYSAEWYNRQVAKPPIQVSDIRGIIHSHSRWSDGINTIEEMAIAARNAGFEYLVITDHSKTAFYANGLNEERIMAQHVEIDALNAKLAPFKIFKGIESDILSDGSLDYADDVLATFDIIVASVHSNLKMAQEKAMERVLAAIRNPFTSILGHPTGRLLLSRPGYPLDMKEIIATCARHKVAIELNAHPRRLDVDWRFIDEVLDAGVMISIDPDAHSVAGFSDVQYGVAVAQKTMLQPNANVSSLTLSEFERWVAVQKAKRPK